MTQFTSLADLANEAKATKIIKEATSPKEFAEQVYQMALDLIERPTGSTAVSLRRGIRLEYPELAERKQRLIDAVTTMFTEGCIQLLVDKSLSYGPEKFDPYRVAMRLFPYWDLSSAKPQRRKMGLIRWLDAMSLYSFDKNTVNDNLSISGIGVIGITDAAAVYADRTRTEPTAQQVVEEISELKETGWEEDAPSRNFGDSTDPDNRKDQATDDDVEIGKVMDAFDQRLHYLVKEELDVVSGLAGLHDAKEVAEKGLEQLATHKLITNDTKHQQLQLVGQSIETARETLKAQLTTQGVSY